jgi:hypothetical protein
VIDAVNEIYFTGHSLGGAFSVVAADRIREEKPDVAAKVFGGYTIGGARGIGSKQHARWADEHAASRAIIAMLMKVCLPTR